MIQQKITFNPGPSQLAPHIINRINELANSGILSISHRSDLCRTFTREAVDGLRQQLKIPDDYHIVFQPSATCCMETIVANTVDQNSFHFVSGVFSQRIYNTALELGKNARIHDSIWTQPVMWQEALIPDDTELITITHCETSTGLIWPTEQLSAVRRTFPKPLIAVDVTSTFGAMALPWQQADIWFSSVQKCLGLPAGLAVMMIGPRARAVAADETKKRTVAQWRRFDSLTSSMQQNETKETPNVLAIALLAYQMKEWDLKKIEEELYKKAEVLYQKSDLWSPYIKAEKWRSPTVANLKTDNAQRLHNKAERAGFTIGYGILKDQCIRIANFPAISYSQLEDLYSALSAQTRIPLRSDFN